MNDPYLKPVIFGGLLISILSVICPLGIFIWSGVGGYVAAKLVHRVTKELLLLTDSLLVGLFVGIVSGTSLDVLAIVSFSSDDNKQTLVRMLKKNWPKDVKPIPDLNEMLPAVFLTTSVFILLITILFSIIGSLVGMYIVNKKDVGDKTV